MWQVIGAALGLVTSANEGAQKQYADLRGEYQSTLGYTRAKTMSYYDAYSSGAKYLVIAVGVVAIVILAVVFTGKKKQ